MSENKSFAFCVLRLRTRLFLLFIVATIAFSVVFVVAAVVLLVFVNAMPFHATPYHAVLYDPIPCSAIDAHGAP